eukprot:CAMPEP_0173177686 /NCGR_PEP_ID=MMETSP1141-20130122/5124_1 /TAXON_ID=483371 /ORGANISM="non described non described, Strain CCMP2298" /LENGTH=109 /DNA_ID=CAMNT_0014100105 /DNA_START=43 /DNA_END=372 /DNA_ORIENTATION=+
MSTLSESGPIELIVRDKISSSFQPTFLDVINESYKHNVPKGSESHFKVVVVSQTFEGMSLIQRHRAVNHSLGDMLKNDIHALSIQAKTPAQWSADSTVGSTPNCLGGDK